MTEEYRPRLIHWRLTRPETEIQKNGTGLLSTSECILIIDGIAKTSRPIVVLSGHKLSQRRDLAEIVDYGMALGLKIIVELEPWELNDDLLMQYRRHGPKVLRINSDNCISEDPNVRFRQTEQFYSLGDCITRMKKAGYEIHLSFTIRETDARALAFYHDYAFRNGADGIYCHLMLNDVPVETVHFGSESKTDEFIQSIAHMKNLSPRRMYFSPQCLKYGYVGAEEEENDRAPSNSPWQHWCLAGKSFVFLNEEGVINVCAGIPLEVGNLRNCRYKFEEVWRDAGVLNELRSRRLTCFQAQQVMGSIEETS